MVDEAYVYNTTTTCVDITTNNLVSVELYFDPAATMQNWLDLIENVDDEIHKACHQNEQGNWTLK